MSYNTKNYTEQGGEKTVIGGVLEFGPEAEVKNFPGGGGGGGYELPTASDSVKGGIKVGDGVYMVGETLHLFVARVGMVGGVQAAADPGDSEATDIEGLVADYNKLLAALRTAGIIKSA